MNNKKNEALERPANCFGYPRFSPLTVFTAEKEALQTKIRADAIKYLFGDKSQMFDEIARVARQELNNKIHQSIQEIEMAVERQIRYSQNENGFVQNRLRERCFRIKEQLMAGVRDLKLNFKASDKLIDVGAGSGVIAQMLQQELGLEYAFLTDVVDYRYPEVKASKNVNFRLFDPPFDKIASDDLFQLGIITNTLHHCDEPLRVFDSYRKKLAPGAILLVVESCIGITQSDVDAHGHSSLIPYQTLYKSDGSLEEDQLAYLELPKADKMLYGSFFDWIYNRIFLNENINVPYNFGRIQDWNEHFEKTGFKVLRTYLMGFDQPAALEFHTLHIIKKN